MTVSPWLRRLFSSPGTTRRGTVLVFAQDPLLSSLFEAALRPAGFDVLLATTIEDGVVSHWENHRSIALIVVADPPSGMTTRQLLGCLRAADPATPCCVLTELGGSPDEEAALGAAMRPRPSTVAEARMVIPSHARPAGRQLVQAC